MKNEVRAELLTTTELARVLKCSVSAIKAWRRDGLPAHRVGRRLWRFDLEAVLAWFTQQSPDAIRASLPPRSGTRSRA